MCVVGIFKSRAPVIYQRYQETIDYVQERRPGTYACFHPWASVCLTLGDVAVDEHKDRWNLLFGWCHIIPFNFFDHRVSSRIGIVELGVEFEVGPGIPIWVPSAMYTHYNTLLREKGMRQSLVAWTGAPIFQWKDLGGRSVSRLTAAEKADYIASLPRHIAEGLACFPLEAAFLSAILSS